MSADDHPHNRRIRSFVRREGRLTTSQANALETLWPRYGLPETGKIDLAEAFGRDAPTVCEIGFGNGENLLAACKREPERNFIGVEVHRPGVGRLLRQAEEAGIENLRVSTADAVDLLTEQMPEASLAAVWLFFPDPWHKKRHNKRRIVQPAFASLVASRLVVDGEFQLATDWAEYAEWMHEVLEGSADFERCDALDPETGRPVNRIQTHFERRGLKRGHKVADFLYRLNQ